MGDKLQFGIDVGAVSIGVAVLKDGSLLSKSYAYHNGDIPGTLRTMIGNLGISRANLGLTGRGIKMFPGGRRVDDVVAAVEGVKWAAPRLPSSVLLIGGENVLLITLHPDGSYSGHEINTDCASGTGVFLDQQASRLACDAARLADLAAGFEGLPPSIATRCAVFAKTDLIHSQQQGKEYGIPVINLFYDGLRSPNENLEPHIFYLRQAKASALEAG